MIFLQQTMWMYTMNHHDISGCFLDSGDPFSQLISQGAKPYDQKYQQ